MTRWRSMFAALGLVLAFVSQSTAQTWVPFAQFYENEKVIYSKADASFSAGEAVRAEILPNYNTLLNADKGLLFGELVLNLGDNSIEVIKVEFAASTNDTGELLSIFALDDPSLVEAVEANPGIDLGSDPIEFTIVFRSLPGLEWENLPLLTGRFMIKGSLSDFEDVNPDEGIYLRNLNGTIYAEAIPDASTLALFGTGLLPMGWAFLRRRK